MPLDPALCISAGASVREALAMITKNSRQAIAVVDADGRLAGLVTDGDVRRGLLRGVGLEDRVSQVMNAHPVVGRPGAPRAETLALMERRSLRHLPVVDDGGRLVDLLLREELERPAVLPNWAVVMAGGAGTRLRPLTAETPKPMLRVGGKPILEILVERLRAAGVRDFHLTVGYKPETIEAHFGDGAALGVRIRYVREPEPLGTAGALALLAEPPVEPFLLVNGDILTRCDFRAMLQFHERTGADMTVGMVAHTVEVP
ncbi:MAG TPA: sugar phosphate nucleotidyltransferase, partial [Methylomirabilota bacterium]|nr:sugar phosphate nucleotidyltransferase [Methylomirabilota bacterium]